ncbi:hypothetical protein MML48_2g00009469 [Holotrichia oblita]|uniref:Uncharacterized protein n=1 Tax=Holotrichia oblita TaxID=644536 RepID=A0ACB9TKH9_HOLOL|nr:hypothetical protein MML48_2g00009469 [Holotrichia oblita]
MSTELTVEDNVKIFINNILKKYNLNTDTNKITYNPGSGNDDGYMSTTYAVDINDSKQSLHLFLKCALNVTFPGGTAFKSVYTNEIYFYERVIPAYMEFLGKNGVTDSFRNVPECYGSADKKILALRNLRSDGYDLCDKKFIGNEEHIELVLKTYAKFHAIGFGYKDQKPELYNKLVEGVVDIFSNASEDLNKQRVEGAKVLIQDFLSRLDPRKDKFILDQSQNIVDKLTEFDLSLRTLTYANSILIHGDCWCNNMMFKYTDSKEYPDDVMLLDWQMIRSASPALDLVYFFYTTAPASEEILKRVDIFLKIYHEELSNQIKQLGSDPDKLYPLSLLKKEWQEYAKFGFCRAFLILKAMLGGKEELPSFDDSDMTEVLKRGSLFNNVDSNHEYIRRLRNLAEHFLLKELI